MSLPAQLVVRQVGPGPFDRGPAASRQAAAARACSNSSMAAPRTRSRCARTAPPSSGCGCCRRVLVNVARVVRRRRSSGPGRACRSRSRRPGPPASAGTAPMSRSPAPRRKPAFPMRCRRRRPRRSSASRRRPAGCGSRPYPESSATSRSASSRAPGTPGTRRWSSRSICRSAASAADFRRLGTPSASRAERGDFRVAAAVGALCCATACRSWKPDRVHAGGVEHRGGRLLGRPEATTRPSTWDGLSDARRMAAQADRQGRGPPRRRSARRGVSGLDPIVGVQTMTAASSTAASPRSSPLPGVARASAAYRSGRRRGTPRRRRGRRRWPLAPRSPGHGRATLFAPAPAARRAPRGRRRCLASSSAPCRLYSAREPCRRSRRSAGAAR